MSPTWQISNQASGPSKPPTGPQPPGNPYCWTLRRCCLLRPTAAQHMVLSFSSLRGGNTHTNTCTYSFAHNRDGGRKREEHRNADKNTKIVTKYTKVHKLVFRRNIKQRWKQATPTDGWHANRATALWWEAYCTPGYDPRRYELQSTGEWWHDLDSGEFCVIIEVIWLWNWLKKETCY